MADVGVREEEDWRKVIEKCRESFTERKHSGGCLLLTLSQNIKTEISITCVINV